MYTYTVDTNGGRMLITDPHTALAVANQHGDELRAAAGPRIRRARSFDCPLAALVRWFVARGAPRSPAGVAI